MGVKVPDEIKLKRYLHYASVGGTYTPGCRFHESHYDEKNIKSLRNVLNALKRDTIFEIIKKVYEDGSSPHPQMIAFVLAECAKINYLKSDALKTAEMLCNDSKLFLLFFKYGLEIPPKIGSGPACKRLMGAYYLKKDVMKLTEEVAKLPRYRGWSHKDLIRLGHITAKPDDYARLAVLTYITYGAEEMNKKFGGNENAKVVVDYLTQVQNFRKEVDEKKVVLTIETYSLTIDHLNPIYLNNKNVWIALMRQIPLDSLLDSFNRIARKKLFRLERIWDEDFQRSFFDAIQDSQSIEKSGIHPNRVFVEYVKYKHLSDYKHKMATINKKPFIEPKKSGDIIKNIRDLMEATYKNMKPTDLKFLIVIEPLDENRRTSHMRFLSSEKAATCVLDYFVNVEPSVTVFVTSNVVGESAKIHESKKPASLDLGAVSLSTFVPLKSAAKETNTPAVANFSEWATKAQRKFDCIIVIGDRLCFRTYISQFNKYQNNMKLNGGKLVLLNLCHSAVPTVDAEDVLIVTGFDDKTIPIITSFASEHF